MKLLIKKKYTLKKYRCFWYAYNLYMVFSLMSHSMFAKYLYKSTNIVFMLIWILILWGEFKQRKTNKKELLLALICLGMFLITFRISSYPYATIFLIIFASRNIEFSQIAKVTVWISLICLGVIFLCANIGIIDNYIFTGYRDNGVYKQRQSLGFLYALYPSTIFFNVVALEIYLKRISIKWFELVILTIASFYLYTQTDARLCFLTTIVLIIYIMWIKIKARFSKSNKYAKSMYGILKYSYIISFAISWFMTIGFMQGSKVFSYLPESIIGRFSMNVAAIARYGISFWGSKIQFSGSGLNILGEKVESKYFYVDNLYIQTLLHYGICFILLFIVSYTVALFIVYKNKDFILLVILAILAFHGIIDDLILKLDFNTFMFTIVMVATDVGEHLRNKLKIYKYNNN